MLSNLDGRAGRAPFKPCNICNGKSCVAIPSIASTRYLCLLHYYTTGAHRERPRPPGTGAGSAVKKKTKNPVLMMEGRVMQRQLPDVQDLFAEAFVELQKEIGEESARAFQSAADAEDPLALLLDSTTPSQAMARPPSRKQASGRRSSFNKHSLHDKRKDDTEGGFIREAVLPERLRKLKTPGRLEGIESIRNSTTNRRKRSLDKTKGVTKPFNPYQRKQTPATNVWNRVLDANEKTPKEKKHKTTWEDMEREMISDITSGNNASAKTCSCGSNKVEIKGNVTSRNNDMMKGEVWGMKDRAEVVVERCHCLSCGKSWNED